MGVAVAIDIYGTLIDPQQISVQLQPLVGSLADRIAEVWRTKQLEYSFRRAAMKRYEDFAVCTRQALAYALDLHGVTLSTSEQNGLLQKYQELPTFPDVAGGLTALRGADHKLWAFSNGVAANVRSLMSNARLLDYFEGIVSTDEVKSFKPDPRVYEHLLTRLVRPAGETWLISSNPFDVIGAKAVGIQGLWLKRHPRAIFDQWDILPDLTAANLEDAALQLNKI